MTRPKKTSRKWVFRPLRGLGIKKPGLLAGGMCGENIPAARGVYTHQSNM
jgi:hypothetical protein